MLLALVFALAVQDTIRPDTSGDLLSNEGVVRAAGAVDSVFVARTRESATLSAGDWTAYLMARLGVNPIPTTGLRVVLDSSRLRVRGRLGDIPQEAQLSLATLLSMFPPDTPIEASVLVDRPSPTVARFHLDSAWIAQLPVPEALLGPGLRVVGSKYPVLTDEGRDLLVEVPAGAKIEFTPAGIRLTAAPPPPPRPARRPTRRPAHRP